MSEETKQPVGSIGWTDLTVPDAEKLRDFYKAVVGWQSSGLDMGGYEDFCMNEPESGKTVAGICHARGMNADIPPVWLVYMVVQDLDASIAACKALGGQVIAPVREMGGRMCVIKDPAGAIAALFEPKQS